MDRRKALATTGAISLTASAAIIALGSSMGLFGLANNDGSRVGKLSPIDSTVSQPTTKTRTIIVNDPPASTNGSPVSGGESQERGRAVGEDSRQRDAGAATTPTVANTAPSGAVEERRETETRDDQGGADTPSPSRSDSGHEDD